jgi:glucose-6-phosphate 1-dehydrogenase
VAVIPRITLYLRETRLAAFGLVTWDDMTESNSPLSVVIFGASGDLTARKLIPALYNLHLKKRLPDDTRILGVARTAHSESEFRDTMTTKVREAFQAVGEEWNEGEWKAFAEKLQYVATDVTKPEGVTPIQAWFNTREGDKGGRRLYYMSISPELYPQVSGALGEAGFHKETGGFRRLIIEKPFGHDLGTAKELNKALHKHWREDQLYRIDHYLGKETVQNIMVFRFANTLFEPLWNYQYIDHVQITVGEEVTVGRRGAYYDGSGVLRDMFQSHILQVMTLVAMESPSRFNADNLRNEKKKVLDAITIPSLEEARKQLVVGQYAGYRQEPGVPKDSKTPTYAALRLEIQNSRWKNVPFYLRSGKGLQSRYSEIMIQFRCPPHLMFPLPKDEILQCNRMTLVLQPNEGIHLNFQTKVPSVDGVKLQPRDLAFNYDEAFTEKLPEAYERLLLDAIQGDASLFMRSDEIEQAWEIMDPLIAASQEMTDPTEYAVGSQGPKCAEEFLAREGRHWQPLPGK